MAVSRRTFLKLLPLTVGAGLVPYGVYASSVLETTFLPIPLAGLPAGFDGFTVCHLTDLHLAEFGQNQADLVSLIRENKPDLIAMTGDMVNRDDRDESAFLTLCDQLPEIAQTCFVSGNHEMCGSHEGLEQRLMERGVQVMDNRHVELERDGEILYLAGVGEWWAYGRTGLDAAMENIPSEGIVILLAHHPEEMPHYVECGANLVLAGHTHGGQVKLPFVGSLIAPNQGFFPRYPDGLFREGGTAMYVSRGLGLSSLPMRFNCPREVAFLTLKRA